MSTTLDRALEGYRDRQTHPESHPDMAAITALARNEIDPEDEASLLDHVSECRPCAELLLDLKCENRSHAFPASDEPDAKDAWLRLQTRLANADQPMASLSATPASPRDVSPPRPAFWRRLSFAYSLAALLALTLTIYFFTQPTTHTDKSRTVMAAPTIVHLLPAGQNNATRSPADQDPVRGDLILLLISTQIKDYPNYRLVVSSPSSGVVLEKDGLRRQENDSFAVAVATETWSRGAYRLQIYGLDGRNWVALDRYDLTLEEP